MRPKAGESSAQFALRVEMERKRLSANRVATWHAFKGYLDDPTMQVLEMVRVNKKTSGAAAAFGWEDVVTVCKDRTSGLALTARPPAVPSRAPPARVAAPAAAPPPTACSSSRGSGRH